MSPLDNTLALNPQGMDGLRKLANSADSREGIKAAAKQFESYFLQLMLKSMRETLSQDGPFDSQETRTFTEMFDQQIAQRASQGRGLGLADLMIAQLGTLSQPAEKLTQADNLVQESPVQPVPVAGTLPDLSAPAAPSADSNGKTPASAPGSFVDRLWPHAVEAARSLGVSPHFLVAHAALETGWGKHELKGTNGTASNNLFNIKAGSNWKGKTVEAEVTEFVNGKPVKLTEKFRAYDSPAGSFADYVNLLGSSPRYAGVLNQDAEGFVRGLQQGGYATDPAYAEKLRRVIGSAALRLEMAG